MMGSITGHTGTENQHRPMAPNGSMWLWDARLWLLQELDPGGLLCGKSVRLNYCCLYNQRPWPSWWSSCLREFQQGKWTGSLSTSGLKRTEVALSHCPPQPATCRCFKTCGCCHYSIKAVYRRMFDLTSPTPNLANFVWLFFCTPNIDCIVGEVIQYSQKVWGQLHICLP